MLLAEFSPQRLVQVVQGTAMVVLVINAFALWKQEPRNPQRAAGRRQQARYCGFAGVGAECTKRTNRCGDQQPNCCRQAVANRLRQANAAEPLRLLGSEGFGAEESGQWKFRRVKIVCQ